MPQIPSTVFIEGKPGEKLPFHFRERFDTPSYTSPFYIDSTEIYNQPLTSPDVVHFHHGVEIEAILSSNAQLYIDGIYYDLQAGDCYYTDAMVPHMIGTVSDCPVRFVFAHINTSLILSIPPPEMGLELLSLFYFPQNSVTRAIKNQLRFGELLSEAYTHFSNTNPLGKITAWAKVVEALSEIAQVISYSTQKTETPSNNALRKTIQTAINFIHTHYNEQITLGHIAKSCNKSPSRLSSVFSTVMNCSPIDYRNKVRIDYALEQVSSTDKKIETIAYDCGFETLSNFQNLFKRMTGHSPHFFRKAA